MVVPVGLTTRWSPVLADQAKVMAVTEAGEVMGVIDEMSEDDGSWQVSLVPGRSLWQTACRGRDGPGCRSLIQLHIHGSDHTCVGTNQPNAPSHREISASTDGENGCGQKEDDERRTQSYVENPG